MSIPHENGLDSSGEDEDDLSPTELELERARDRRRAKSLPAYPEQAGALLRALSHGCRKSVRFADALGLNLASVKHFSAAEEPRVPAHPPRLAPALAHAPAFLDGINTEARARRCGLALESMALGLGRVYGTIRVPRSAAGPHEVGVRYTLDEWRTYVDARAAPAPDGERFAFSVCASPRPEPGAAVHFALYLRAGGGEFWDNNDGQNYTVRPGHVSL